jgi:hypothetical protein
VNELQSEYVGYLGWRFSKESREALVDHFSRHSGVQKVEKLFQGQCLEDSIPFQALVLESDLRH